MIRLHKLRGEELWVNPDLIAFVEGGPQTVIHLTDQHRVIVNDSPETVSDAVRRHRAEVLALAGVLRDEGVFTGDTMVDPDRHLQIVPAPEER